MPQCFNQGYLKCDRQLKVCPCYPPLWKGCGKRLCPEHIECHYSRMGVEFYHCKLSPKDLSMSADALDS